MFRPGIVCLKQYQTFQEAQDIIEQFLSGVVRVVVRKFPISIFIMHAYFQRRSLAYAKT
jgi:hypothetical protein